MIDAPFALITGASRGLGRHLAVQFWNSGWSLFLAARDGGSLEILSRELPPKTNQKVHIIPCDLGNEAQVHMLINEVKQDVDCLDLIINNAAIQGPIGPIWDNDMDVWRRVIDVNLLAPVTICKAFLPKMIDKRSGVIINISGGGATGPRANFSAYATAKAGLVRFSETIAQEVGSIGVRVNCIAPGVMPSSLLEEVILAGPIKSGEKEYKIALKTMQNENASLEKISQLAIFLASNLSEGITGKLISAAWDNWEEWPQYLKALQDSDVYTLRRIVGRDRNMSWGDK